LELISVTKWTLICANRLAEVGVLETPKLQGKYDTGQVSQLMVSLVMHIITGLLM